MADDVCILEALVDLEPRDPLDVIAGLPPVDHQGRELPHGLNPQSSFEIAWKLAH